MPIWLLSYSLEFDQQGLSTTPYGARHGGSRLASFSQSAAGTCFLALCGLTATFLASWPGQKRFVFTLLDADRRLLVTRLIAFGLACHST
jgi:hypothetical protein